MNNFLFIRGIKWCIVTFFYSCEYNGKICKLNCLLKLYYTIHVILFQTMYKEFFNSIQSLPVLLFVGGLDIAKCWPTFEKNQYNSTISLFRTSEQ